MRDWFKIYNPIFIKKNYYGRGLVKMSSSWFDEDVCSITQSTFSTWSLIKWFLALMYLVLELDTIFFHEVYGTNVVEFYHDNSKINYVIT